MTSRRRLGAVAGILTLAAGLLALPTAPATASGSSGGYSTNTGGCTAYATGTGMGSYCLGGGGNAETLRERFGKQKFDRCRFSELPKGMTRPYNAEGEDKGKWWVRSCINYIDWDTVAGGPERQFNVHLAYLPLDYDTSYNATPLSEFLWGQVTATTQFPAPFLQAKPTPVPRVGVPAYMTFRWIDPGDPSGPVVSDRHGPYAGEDDGGPFIQIRNPQGLLMRARATDLAIDPLQKDMAIVRCKDVDPGYDPELGPDPKKQKSNCYMLFPRSSATARERAQDTDREIPKALGDVYMLRISVYWEVEYSNDDGATWEPLGAGAAGNRRDLIQITDQPLPVREAQAANLPPRLSFS